MAGSPGRGLTDGPSLPWRAGRGWFTVPRAKARCRRQPPAAGTLPSLSAPAVGYAALNRAATVATRLPWYAAELRAVSSTGIAPWPLTWLVP